MNLIGRKSRRPQGASSVPTPDEEYEVLSDEHSRLRAQIRDLEGFIDGAPQVRQQRIQETRVTLPPIDDSAALHELVLDLEDDAGEDGGEGRQARLARRHLVAIRRARRRNFYIFLLSAAAVAAFLYWVSLVVQ